MPVPVDAGVRWRACAQQRVGPDFRKGRPGAIEKTAVICRQEAVIAEKSRIASFTLTGIVSAGSRKGGEMW
jgi:hypothetical protein